MRCVDCFLLSIELNKWLFINVKNWIVGFVLYKKLSVDIVNIIGL